MERTSKSYKIVLASGSPRRKELLEKAGYDFEILVPTVDEKSVSDKRPSRLVVKESVLKNRTAVKEFGLETDVVISADTIVYRKKEYGKPRDLQDAVDILTTLCGKWHSVYTGVTVRAFGKEKSFAVCSLVRLKALTKKEIEDYVYTMKPLDKAGAYAIQENTMVEKFSGSYANIVGLPIERLQKELRKLGVTNG